MNEIQHHIFVGPRHIAIRHIQRYCHACSTIEDLHGYHNAIVHILIGAEYLPNWRMINHTIRKVAAPDNNIIYENE